MPSRDGGTPARGGGESVSNLPIMPGDVLFWGAMGGILQATLAVWPYFLLLVLGCMVLQRAR